MDNNDDKKKPSTLSPAEIETINKSIIEQLKAQSSGGKGKGIIIAGGAGGAGTSSK